MVFSEARRLGKCTSEEGIAFVIVDRPGNGGVFRVKAGTAPSTAQPHMKNLFTECSMVAVRIGRYNLPGPAYWAVTIGETR